MIRFRSFNICLVGNEWDIPEFVVSCEDFKLDDKSITFFIDHKAVCYIPIHSVYSVKEFFIDDLSFDIIYHK